MSFSFVPNNFFSYMEESTIHTLLKCKLCNKPFVDPVLTQTGDRFCRLCVIDFNRRNPKLTEDQRQARIDGLTPVTETLVLEMLNGLPVRCTKCRETNLMRGKLEEHYNTTCMQATVTCRAADIKCPWEGTREEKDDHADVCRFEPIRTALGAIFTKHEQLKNRLESLETELNELTATRRLGQIKLNS